MDKTLTEDSYPLLEDYIWPGNLTQLKNFLKRCYDFSSNHIVIKSNIIKQEINNEFKYANKDYLENWKLNLIIL